MKNFQAVNFQAIGWTLDASPHSHVSFTADEVGDEYHTIHELYQCRMALNVALFNYIAAQRKSIGLIQVPENILNTVIPQVFKSKHHSDGTMFDGYFIVMMIRQDGKQISYHYDLKHWEEFKIPKIDKCPEYDGHNTQDCIDRLINLV